MSTSGEKHETVGAAGGPGEAESGALSTRRLPFHVRPYQSDDAIEALRLYRQCLPADRDPEEWVWKFERPLTDPPPPFHVAEAGGRLVGFFPARAVRFQFGDTLEVASQCQDVCVHPDHRGGAILRAMWEANERGWRVAGIPFAFGFPTVEHLRFGLRFMGYVDLFRLQIWRRRLARGLRLQARLPSGWARRLAYRAGASFQAFSTPPQAPPSPDGIKVGDLLRFDLSTDLLWDRVRSQVRFAAVRDAAYLTWRYLERPGQPFRIIGATRNGQLDGYCVFRDDLTQPDGCHAGAMMDLVSTDPAVARRLVDAALARMQAVECGYALALAHPASPTAPVLASAGFAPDPGERGTIFCGKSYAEDLDVEAIRRPENWLLAYGDTDHVG